MMREILTAEGHATREAPDGRTAVALFYAEPFDIVFTDMHMPGFTGYDVAREIKKAKPSMPVVLMTGWDIESEPAELKAKGIDLLIKKPFTITDIVLAIELLCP